MQTRSKRNRSLSSNSYNDERIEDVSRKARRYNKILMIRVRNENDTENKTPKTAPVDIYKAGFISSKVMMVKPTNFGTNYETLQDNKFMKESKEASVQENALSEFNEMVKNLQNRNIDVVVHSQYAFEATDSVFPNNWFSTHKNEHFPEGLLIIYPIKSKNRRLEKNQEIIEGMKKDYSYFIDLSYLEEENEFLESTGCLIFDHVNRKVYCGISERATERACNVFIEMFNKYSKNPYRLVTFHATDEEGNSIYHTNVLMSVLEKHVVICLETIKDPKERKEIEREISEKKGVISVTMEELRKFCCNVITVKSKDGKTVVIMSQTAYDNFSAKNMGVLKNNYEICSNDIRTVEEIGGGSARCMVGEIYDHYIPANTSLNEIGSNVNII